MNKISVTIEGATWGEVIDQMEQFVGYPTSSPLPGVAEAAQMLTKPVAVPVDAEFEPPHVAASFPPFAGSGTWPPGECPVHHKPFKDGAYGPFCTAKGGNGPLSAKGYCDLKPGMQFNGKSIPQAA